MTGYGETGPMALFFSFGPLLEAYCGLNSVTGYLGEGPMRLGKAFPDVVGGLHGTLTALCAVWERAATGVDGARRPVAAGDAGVRRRRRPAVDVGHRRAARTRRGNRSLDHAPQGVYRCAGDDAWLARHRHRRRRVAGAGRADRRGRAACRSPSASPVTTPLDAAIERWTAARSARSTPPAQLQALGIPACPAFSNGDLVESEHLAAREFMVTWDQPDAGPQRFPGFPIHFERRRYEPVAAPALGADNATILRRLGYPEARIQLLADAGVIAEQPPW